MGSYEGWVKLRRDSEAEDARLARDFIMHRKENTNEERKKGASAAYFYDALS